MAITREKKEQLVEMYINSLNESDGIILAEYRGLSVSQMEQLRGKIREAEGAFTVIKNTLARRAFAEVGLPLPDDILVGPIGITFGRRNLTGVAKAMTDFAKDNELLVIKGGLVGANIITGAAVKDLANMPPIEVLRAQFLGLLSTPGTKLARVLNAPGSQMVTVLSGGVQQLVNVLSAYTAKEGE